MKRRQIKRKSTNLVRTHKAVRKDQLRQLRRKAAGRYGW